MSKETEFVQRMTRERLTKFIKKEEKPYWFPSIFYPAKAAVEASKVQIKAMEMTNDDVN